MTQPLPHYVRFARSLALLGVAAAGCSATNTPAADAHVTPGTDAYVVLGTDAHVALGTDAHVTPDPDAHVTAGEDAAVAVDAFDICTTCTCFGRGGGGGGEDAGPPDCFTVPGAEGCCVAVGPLSPPDLAV